MTDPNSTNPDSLVNDAITSIQSGDTDTANKLFEQAAQIYEQNGDDVNAQDARDMITPA